MGTQTNWTTLSTISFTEYIKAMHNADSVFSQSDEESVIRDFSMVDFNVCLQKLTQLNDGEILKACKDLKNNRPD